MAPNSNMAHTASRQESCSDFDRRIGLLESPGGGSRRGSQRPVGLSVEELQLVPGMSAEVMIVTGASIPLEYLLKPILTSIDRALREN